MSESAEYDSLQLAEHFFRKEYGKIVSVITRYIGVDSVETAEDIVQETLIKAADHWQNNGIPENPEAWLYTTAKNLTLNILKRKKYFKEYEKLTLASIEEVGSDEFSEKEIEDEQLRMMFVCCHPSIPENSQIALILKILCGFSITEIANSFFSNNETINKRLVRGRKCLRENKIDYEFPNDLSEKMGIVLKTIYLLFNEGYFPNQKNKLIRYDLCIEAIRLVNLLVDSDEIEDKTDCYALLALMYLNASRFEARMNEEGLIIEMENQDREKWDKYLIQQGIDYLGKATESKEHSRFLILATISANHCIAPSFEETNWQEILSLYDQLVKIEDSPITRLNRSVILAQVHGNEAALRELNELETYSDIANHYLFHATKGELYKRNNQNVKAASSYRKAISLTNNQRDVDQLKKKIRTAVPN